MDAISRKKKRVVHPEQLDAASLGKSKNPFSPCESLDLGVSSSEDLSLSAPHPGPTVFSTCSDDFPVSEEVIVKRASTPLEMDVLRRRTSGSQCSAIFSPNGKLGDDQGEIPTRLRDLADAFRTRSQKFRSRLDLPLTPSTAGSKVGHAVQPPPLSDRAADADADADHPLPEEVAPPRWLTWWLWIKNLRPSGSLNPQGYRYIAWLSVVTLFFLYNAWVIPLRSSFPYQTPSNTPYWLVFDYMSDFVYVIDVLVFRPRIMYLEQGIWVTDAALMRKNYINTVEFKMDLLSLLPLDLLYIPFGFSLVVVRLPRMLKFQTFNELYNRLDSKVPKPVMVRVGRAVIFMLYMIHVNACMYYSFSAWEGIGTTAWTFNGEGNAYLRCFFFATKTATSIGRNPKPVNKYEMVFMACLWLMGVFVFAMLLGQMRDIVVTATAVENEFRFLVDTTVNYMRSQKLPDELQDRVKLWFTFTWAQQRTLDERSITEWLPLKLKTDVAINVHINTLSKVQLFKDCDATLLRDIVLKLKPVIFLPKDYIIRKGEVGKEMFIVLSGQVQVVGGANDEIVFVTLSQGSVFGEISLLALAGNNRRTATIRSHGFSNLFVLSKSDLTEAIEHHPDAQRILQLKAQELVRESLAKEKAEARDGLGVIIGNKVTPMKTPRLVRTVLEAVPSDSRTAQLLQYGSKREPLRRRRPTLRWQDSSSGDPSFNKMMGRAGGSSSSSFSDVGSSSSHYGEVRQSPTNDGNNAGNAWTERGNDADNTWTDRDNDAYDARGNSETGSRRSNSDLAITVEDENMFECRVTVHREMN